MRKDKTTLCLSYPEDTSAKADVLEFLVFKMDRTASGSTFLDDEEKLTIVVLDVAIVKSVAGRWCGALERCVKSNDGNFGA